MPSQKKIDLVKSLTKTLVDSQNFVIVDFGALSHKQLEDLRTTLRKKNAYLKVIKKSLLEVALKQIKRRDMTDDLILQGPSACLVLDEDWNEGLSAFYSFSKQEETLTFKVGFLDNAVTDSDMLEKLAQLPSKTELVAKIITSLKSPQSRVVYSLNFGISRLTNVLRQAGE